MPLSLEIVTPDGVAWHDADVDSVTLPAKDGEIDILPGHVPLITILNAGMVEVSQKGHRQDLAIDRGYARCMGDVISVLTEAAIEVEHIDTQAAEEAQAQALRALEEAKKQKLDDSEIERLEAVARFALAQLITKGRHK